MNESQRTDEQPPQSPDGEDTPGAQRLKPYQSPVLTEYGPVAQLTQGVLSQASDGPGGGRRMMRN